MVDRETVLAILTRRFPGSPPGQLAVPVTTSGRRKAARPAATTTSVAGQRVVSMPFERARVSRTVSS